MTRSYLSDGDRLILKTVEAPQKADLLKAFKVVQLIAKGASTPTEIATGLNLGEREAVHHLSAAQALRLVRRVPQMEPAEYMLGYLGEAYLAAKDDKTRDVIIVRAVLNAPYVVHVAELLGLPLPLAVPTPRELRDVALVEVALARVGGLSGDTLRRSANALVAWMKTIDRRARRR
jgi:hypothetical protein